MTDDRRAKDAESVERKPDEGARGALAERPGEPPVVARMIVEIRSDGTRTIARGAIEAHGSSPLSLARSLAKSMFSAPALARQAVKALLLAKKGHPRPDD